MEKDEETLQQRIAAAIKDAGLTTAQYAAVTGTFPEDVLGWVNGNRTPSPIHLRVLSETTGVTLSWLREGTKGHVSEKIRNIISVLPDDERDDLILFLERVTPLPLPDLDTRDLLTTRRERCERANNLIKDIAHCGRGFFRWGMNIAKFVCDEHGRVWFIDHYSKDNQGNRKAIETTEDGPWIGFTGGGTLKSIAHALAKYIKRGTPVTVRSLHTRNWAGDEEKINALIGNGLESGVLVRMDP